MTDDEKREQRNPNCAYCAIPFEEDETADWVESTPQGYMHDSCYIDWRDDD